MRILITVLLSIVALSASAQQRPSVPTQHKISDIIARHGEPSRILKPIEVLQSAELYLKYGKYVDDSHYAATSHGYADDVPLTNYIYDQPRDLATGRKVKCRFEFSAGADGLVTGSGTSCNCEITAIHRFDIADYWVRGNIAEDKCLE